MSRLYYEGQIFIPIISDYGFKATFGNEENTLFLRKALQALIKSDVPIKQVTFIANEQKRLALDSRMGVFDLGCVDENGHFFIVEMQLGGYPEFIQRMKFYALYRFNSLVKKGDYKFENLPRIYCIGILAENIFNDIPGYHNIATLKNENGLLIDNQMTYITVELSKFTKPIELICTDLEKLVYTMKNIHTVTEPIQFPQFWDEKWLRVAIDEIDKRSMTPDELYHYEKTLAQNAQVVWDEKRKIDKVKTSAIKKAVMAGKLTVEEIADYLDVTTDFVLGVKKELEDNK